MQTSPHVEIAALQEELTLVKMRDAEAQVNMNELRQRIADLNREWQLYDSQYKNAREKSSADSGQLSNDACELIAHELLTMKMREAQIDSEKKVLSQNLMDMGTQKFVLCNQLKRQDEEIQRIRVELEQARQRENELRTQLHEMKHHMHDGELKVSAERERIRTVTRVSSSKRKTR